MRVHHMLRLNRFDTIFACAAFLLPGPSVAQPSVQAPGPWAAEASWELAVAAGYPEVVALEGAVSAGVGRSLQPRRSGQFRGIEIGAMIGLGAATGRVSWSEYTANDIGRLGWSVDAIVLRPWGPSLGLARRSSYVGGGLSVRALYSRLSVGVLVAPGGRERRVRPRALYSVDWPW